MRVDTEFRSYSRYLEKDTERITVFENMLYISNTFFGGGDCVVKWKNFYNEQKAKIIYNSI